MHVTPRSGGKGFAMSQARAVIVIKLKSGIGGTRT